MHKLLLAASLLLCASVDAFQSPSPVDARIAAAQKQIKDDPKSALACNNLAFALIRKGRDFRDKALYVEANKAIDQSLQLAAGNFDAQKLRVAALLGLNEPAAALKLAKELNHKVPDDIQVWGLLVDANAALGNYDEAEHSAQWVLDLRAGSSLGFEKAAGLREWFGDSEGAIEFLDEANRRTSPNDADQKSWLLTQKARLMLASGNIDGAIKILSDSTRLFPDSQCAAATLAQVRLAQGNYSEAINLLQARYQRVPSAENLYDWAQALTAAGQVQAASVQFATFEKQARAEIAQHNNAILQLISYYSDTKSNPAEALSLATKEATERQDAPTLAAYAWALYRSGKFADAKLQMDKALAVGVRDPVYFCHAAAISSVLKDSASLGRYQKALGEMPRNTCSVSATLQSANEAHP